MKVAEMHTALCSRCGAVMPAAAQCERCGLVAGEASIEQVAAGIGGAAVRVRVAMPRLRGQICACGTPLTAGADACAACGRSRLMLAISGPPPASSRDEPQRRGSPLGMPRSMKVAIGMYVAASLVLSVVGIAAGIGGGGHASEGSPGPGQVAAGGSSQSGATGEPEGNGDRPGSIGGSPGASEASGAVGTAAGSTPGTGASGTGASGAGSGAAPGGATPTSTPTSSPTGAGTSSASPLGPTPTPLGPTPTPLGPTPIPATPTPAATAGDSELYLAITTLPAAVMSNSDVALGATTAAGASCSARVKYQSGKVSLAPGLSKKQTANSAGKVAWVWTVDPDPGTGTATVTCKDKSKQATKSKAFLVL